MSWLSLKSFSKRLLKEDFRTFGVNLMTASIVGGFITHSKMSFTAIEFIVWTGVLGLGLLLFGLHNVD